MKAEYRMLLEENRKNAQLLSDLLVAFRRALARIIGSSHPDYQTLRANRIKRDVLEEGEAEDLPEHLVPEGSDDQGDEPNLAGVG